MYVCLMPTDCKLCSDRWPHPLQTAPPTSGSVAMAATPAAWCWASTLECHWETSEYELHTLKYHTLTCHTHISHTHMSHTHMSHTHTSQSSCLSFSPLLTSPSEWLPDNTLASCLSPPPPSHPHQLHLGTSHSLLLLDTRQPGWPLLQESHDLSHAPQIIATSTMCDRHCINTTA